MVYGLRLIDGDLQISGGSYLLCDGAVKTEQDVTCALVEPLGNDRFHPGWGSTLHNFIGLPGTDTTLFQVQQEAMRVVSNYQAVQYDQVQADALSGTHSRFSTSELIGQVTSVDVQGLLDTFTITIAIQTIDEEDLVLTASVGGGNA